MVLIVGGTAAVLKYQALKATIVGFAQGGMYTDIGSDAGQNQVSDAAGTQNKLQIGGVERAFAGFINDHFSRQRRQFRDDFPTRLAAYQNTSTGADITNAGTQTLGAPTLIVWQIGQIWTVTFTGMDNGKTFLPHPRQYPFNRRDGGTGQ